MITERSTEQTIKLYYDLYVPDGLPDRPVPMIVALHGYEGSKESMMSLAQRINSRDFIIASVQGPSSFFVREPEEQTRPRIGFGWMMQYKAEDTISLHHRTVLSVIEETASTYAIDRGSIFLLAFSQTVSLNYRFAFTHPGMIRGVIAVCGGIPGDWTEDKYHVSDTDVLIIAGETDDFYPIERTRTFKNEIERRARSVEFLSFPAGHVFPRELLPVINDWLSERVKG